VAITWDQNSGPGGKLLDQGEGYVAVEWAGVAVVGVYVSPNSGMEAFEDFLDGVGSCIRKCLPRQALVLGDFNAHSVLWGNARTTARGRRLLDWAASSGLVLVNTGSVQTCVAWRGTSVVDLTWATPGLHPRIKNWRVVEEAETLSDHLYVCMEVEQQHQRKDKARKGRPKPAQHRWSLKDLDKDMLEATAAGLAWSWDARDVTAQKTVDEEAEDLIKDIRKVCDASMPRVSRKNGGKRPVYWWNPDIAEAREKCCRARREYTRAQRRRRTRDEEEISRLHSRYNELKWELKRKIKSSKEQSWKELVQSVDADPWGRPYKIVTRKIRAAAPPLTESMEPELLDQVIENLFPRQETEVIEKECFPSLSFPEEEERIISLPPSSDGGEGESETEEEEDGEITEEELREAVKKMASRNVAPGPDGIPGRIWALIFHLMAPRLRYLFNRCLAEGKYPRKWKTARLVLLRKEGRPPDSPSGYRPICLLDEVGKLLERVIAARLERHMRKESGWHDRQYGFRRNRCTVDAIKEMRARTTDLTSGQGVALAVSLDITNAFNTIPWHRIVEALRDKNTPKHLVGVIQAYLSDRWVGYNSRRGEERKRVERGVPQGSVLGPILWITAYDRVLRSPRPQGTEVICYADDTMVIAGDRWWNETANLAEDAVACVMREIRKLDLHVSPAKSEMVGFYDARRRGPPPPDLGIDVGGGRVMVRKTMKYLGLTIDEQWTFEPHFQQLVPKVARTANALCGLLPNLGGGSTGVRRLYEGVVRSRVLYGAPVWAEDLNRSNRSKTLLRSLHRRTAIRIIRGYRTVSYTSATVLAASPPFELQALALKGRYEYRKRTLQEPEEATQPTDLEEVQDRIWRRWETEVRQEVRERPHRAACAVLPHWERWRQKRGAPLTFRLTQILTGHGVFGEYLKKIGKENTSLCHHCGTEEDTAQHTLEVCPAWELPRTTLRAEAGDELNPGSIVEAVLEGGRRAAAVRDFCERVMLAKEWAERDRIRTRHPSRTARGRRRDNAEIDNNNNNDGA
jgi:hypothetical protein